MERFEDWLPLKQGHDGRINTKPSSKRRSHTEMALDILFALSQGSRRLTHIMCATNISFVNAKQFVSELEAEALVTRTGPRYELTPKGFRAASGYREAKELLGKSAIPIVQYNIGRVED